VIDHSFLYDESKRQPGFRISLRYKLAIPVLVLVLGIFSYLLVTTYHTVRDMMVKSKESRLRTIAEVYAETLKVPLSAKDQEGLKTYLRLLAEQSGVEGVRVENPDGLILATSNVKPRKVPKDLAYDRFSAIGELDSESYAAVANIFKDEKHLGRLVVIFSKFDIEQELQKLFREKFILAALLALVATLIILGISWLVVQPLFKLQKTARCILAGDLDARAKVRSRDEIEEVGEAFNKVVDRLVQSFEHLRLRTQALEESEEKYRSIVDEVNDTIFSITPEGEMIVLNRGFSGYEREQILAEGLPLFFSIP